MERKFPKVLSFRTSERIKYTMRAVIYGPAHYKIPEELNSCQTLVVVATSPVGKYLGIYKTTYVKVALPVITEINCFYFVIV